MRGIDYYELLGVARHASAAEIRSAYRALAKAMHPDTGGTAGAFRLLREAYETLADPERRADYDRGDHDDDGDHGDHGDDDGEYDEPPPPPPRQEPRKRRFGADPDHVPTLPDLASEDLPWWDAVRAARPAALHPLLAPSPAIVAATGAGSVVVLLLIALLDPPVVVWVLVVAGIVAAGVDIGRRFAAAWRVDQQFHAEFGGQVVFGRPGTEADEIAERLTAELLATHLTRIPGVRVFHGLAAEVGSVFADVDHAVLCGRRLVLVESKLWLPGHYEVTLAGEVARNGHRFRGGTVRLPGLISAYRALLPEIEVSGALLTYPSRAGEVTTGEGLAYTPEGFVAEVGTWLTVEPSTVDRNLFRTLLKMVVSPR